MVVVIHQQPQGQSKNPCGLRAFRPMIHCINWSLLTYLLTYL